MMEYETTISDLRMKVSCLFSHYVLYAVVPYSVSHAVCMCFKLYYITLELFTSFTAVSLVGSIKAAGFSYNAMATTYPHVTK